MLLTSLRRLALVLAFLAVLGLDASAQLDPTDLSLDNQLEQGETGARSLSVQLGFYDNGTTGPTATRSWTSP